MKNIMPLLFILLLLTNCQDDVQLEADNNLKTDNTLGASSSMSHTFPNQIPLPLGFSPEGIVNGNGTEFFVGSLLGGAIYKGDLRTGEGFMLVPQQEERVAVGLDYDQKTDYLFVAGGFGVVYVYNATTGAEVAVIELNATPFPGTFINDCIVTKDAAYFTDSFQPVFYRVPLGNNGQLPDPVLVETIPLSGDFQFFSDDFNSNGIVTTPNGKQLIIVNSTSGLPYLVNPMTGVAHEIDLGGTSLSSSDGLVLQGKTLYAVQNFLNQIAVVQLSPDFHSGEVVRTITDPEYKIPTTATIFGSRIYAVNARFDVAPPPFPGSPPPDPTIEFDVIGVDRN